MLNKEKLFRYVLSNAIILAVVGGILSTVIFLNPISGASASSAPLYKGESDKNISLMVNVYWGTEFIEPMLELFESENIEVTFFVGGIWVEKNENLLKRMYLEGHEIGNHGYLHKEHSNLNRDGNVSEISITHKLVKGILNYDMNLFAPPSGDFSDITLSVAEGLGYKTIMWTKDTIDWRDKDSDLIFKRATSDLKGGNLILMHPTEKTLEALPNIIKTIKGAGYRLTNVTNAL